MKHPDVFVDVTDSGPGFESGRWANIAHRECPLANRDPLATAPDARFALCQMTLPEPSCRNEFKSAEFSAPTSLSACEFHVVPHSIWLHNLNIDRALDRLGTYVDPATRISLLRHLVEEQMNVADEPDQLDLTARRIQENRLRISRTLAIIEGLTDLGFMDQEKLTKALAVLAALYDSQVLLEEFHRRMAERSYLETQRPF